MFRGDKGESVSRRSRFKRKKAEPTHGPPSLEHGTYDRTETRHCLLFGEGGREKRLGGEDGEEWGDWFYVKEDEGRRDQDFASGFESKMKEARKENVCQNLLLNFQA